MSLNKRLVRDGRNKLIASVSSGSAGSELVRDIKGQLLGRTNEHFHQTRGADNKLVFANVADSGLLIKGRK